MPLHVSDPTPCAVEATLWRSCLKEFDYGPDRAKGACEKQRTGFYSCIKDWSARQGEPYNHTKFNLVKECAREADTLHQCMMINMFEVSGCQEPMAQLKQCVALHDTAVRRALEGDPALNTLGSEPQGIRRLWYRAIGKL